MSHLAVAEIVIPIVVALGLVVWIALVVHADRHPRQRGQPPASRRDAQPGESEGVRDEVRTRHWR